MSWDWQATAREFGVGENGEFNAGDLELTQEKALIWRPSSGEPTAFSGPELMAAVERAAGALIRLGVERGDRVAGVLGRRPEAIVLPMAVWRIGAIYVPLFSGFGTDALTARLSDSGSAYVFVDDANYAAVSQCANQPEKLRLVTVGDRGSEQDLAFDEFLAEADPHCPAAATTLETPATIMYTSGTTGKPKGCVLPHKAVISLAPMVRCGFALERNEILFSTADTGWSFGLYTTGVAPISMGACRLLYEGPFDAATWLRIAEEEGATHLASAPTGYRQMAAAGAAALPAGELPIKRATSAGEALDGDVIGWFERHLGVTVHDAYGLTEMGMLVANLRTADALPPLAGSMGTALPGFEVEILDEDGNPIEGAGEGRLAVREQEYMLGVDYWGRSAEWEGRRSNGLWLTEDRVRRDESGRLWHVGRSDDIIVTAGYNVAPADVENALMHHPKVADAACVECPDPRKGAVIAAHVVLNGPAEDEAALLAEIRTMVGERVAWHAAPRYLRIKAELPRTESGKVRRGALREWELSEAMQGAPAA